MYNQVPYSHIKMIVNFDEGQKVYWAPTGRYDAGAYGFVLISHDGSVVLSGFVYLGNNMMDTAKICFIVSLQV